MTSNLGMGTVRLISDKAFLALAGFYLRSGFNQLQSTMFLYFYQKRAKCVSRSTQRLLMVFSRAPPDLFEV